MAGKTNQAQYRLLMDKMQLNPDFAKGFTKRPAGELKEFWIQLSGELNELGPPDKDITSWKKVWTDWKSYVKKKLANNKRELNATGGGPRKETKLTEMEEDLASLISLKDTMEGVRNISFGVPKNWVGIFAQTATAPQNAVENATPNEEIEESYVLAEAEDCNSATPKRTKLSNSQLLNKQVDLQEKLYKSIEGSIKFSEEIATSIRKTYKVMDKLVETQKEILKENRRHNMEIEKINKSKLELKEKILENEISRLNQILN